MNFYSKHETRRRLIRGIPNTDSLQRLLGHWFQTPQGRQVLAAEKAFLEPILSRLFGYHILQLGGHQDYSMLDSSPVGHKIQFAPVWRPGLTQAVADNEELPLATDSVDVVLLHHALDFTEDSHRLLREATRVLRPGGHMLIVGFNRYSHWGFWRLFRRRNTLPWRGRFISRGRLTDWLQLLDLTVDRIDYGLHFPPFKYKRLLQYAERLERLGNRLHSPLGGAYFIVCVKEVAPLTPVVPRWQPLPRRTAAFPAAEKVRARIH